MYKYEDFSPQLNTFVGQRMVIEALVKAQKLQETAGAFSETLVTHNIGSDSWLRLALIDRLVELGCLKRIDTNNSYRPGIYWMVKS